ncbi:MAG: hypothetical protein HC866_22535 [Leptolyngbyaceae cyanobacterium RU_5_1]|nr:hypothetical protein [Leptolyngbyaceae cyanobacterium RU_5_1]
MPNLGFDFQWLIQPVELAAFLNQFWQRTPLVLLRQEPDYYADLFSVDDLETVIRFSHPKYPELHLDKPIAQGEAVDSLAGMRTGSLKDYGTFDLGQVYQTCAEGGMVSLAKLHTYWPAIATLCRQLEHRFHAPVSASAHLIHRNLQEFPLHSHRHDAFVLQLEGPVLWRVHPASPYADSHQAEPSLPVKEVCLNAGDLLYIPRGCLHQAIALENASLNLNLDVHVFTWADLLTHALAALDDQTLPFYQALPVGFMQSRDAIAPMQTQLVDLLQFLTQNARVEDAVAHLAQQFLEGMQPLPDGRLRQADDLSQISPETVVTKRKGMVCWVDRVGRTARIQFPGNTVAGPDYLEPALRFIADTETFQVKALPILSSDNSKLVLVHRLIKEGLLRVEDRAGN